MLDVLAPPAPVTIARHRFSRHNFHAMVNSGILTEDDRVELIEGEIVQMSPINAAHAGHINRIVRLFSTRLGERAIVGAQNPIELGNDSEPQPDIALLNPRSDFYEQGHPSAADVLLLVEVADSSLEYDRSVKAPLYARSGVRELWIVNLRDERIELYRDLAGKDYKTRQFVERGETFSALAFPEITFRAEDILG